MKRLLITLICALGALTASAQSTPADDALYQALGGTPGLRKLMADFVPRLAADPRIGEFFKETKLSELQKQLVDQFCVVSGGSCIYEGETMKNSHAEMKIRKADFNALVEVLQQSMDQQGIPFTVQNRLLARLAPMHRDIVNTR
jgi:hemoglobin